MAPGDAKESAESVVATRPAVATPLPEKTGCSTVKRHKHYDGIDCRLFLWMRQQHVFFVSTAPAAPPGGAPCSPNLSPKGVRGTLAVLGPRSLAYLDSYGSGVETIVHTEQEHGGARMSLMMAAFGGAPRIVRFQGTAKVLLRGRDDARFDALRGAFDLGPASKAAVGDYRSIIVLHCERIFDSCGHGVPKMAFESYRTTLPTMLAMVNSDAVHPHSKLPLLQDVHKLNAVSIDGLAGPYPGAAPFPADAAALNYRGGSLSSQRRLCRAVALSVAVWLMLFGTRRDLLLAAGVMLGGCALLGQRPSEALQGAVCWLRKRGV